MYTTIGQVLHLLRHEPRGRWVLVVTLALLLTGVEVVAAALVYSLLSLVSDPSGPISIPGIGDVRALFPEMGQRSILLIVLGMMVLFFTLRGVVKILASYVKARVVQNAAARMSTRLIEAYLSAPYSLHMQRSSSQLIRNGHQVVLETFGQVVYPLANVVAELFVVGGLLALLFVVAPGATGLAVLIVGGAAVLLLLIVQPRLKRVGQTFHEESKATLAAMQEAFAGIRDVKLLGREGYFAKRYGRSRMRMARTAYIRTTVEQFPPVVTETALIGFIVLYFALVVVQGGGIAESVSVLGLFAYAGLRIQPSLQRIVKGFNNIKYATAAIDDLDRDLRDATDLATPAADVEPFGFKDEWRLRDVSFRYDGADNYAIRDVSLVIAPGEQIGICGPTGGGKTTLVDLMVGLLEPTSGRVLVDGENLREVARRWQRGVGVVSQMSFVADDTVRRNIALGVPDHQVDEEALAEAIGLAQLEHVIGDLPSGLDTVVGERGIRISGGQRQRLAIARALYRRPEVLIFDEGTSALDNTTESELMKGIEALRGDRTVVLIAHRLSTVRSCDRVIFVESGRVSAVGTYESLQRENAAFRAMSHMAL